MADKQIDPTEQEGLSKEEHKIAEAQLKQLTENAEAHTTLPDRADMPWGKPPAQGPNISKEEAEFAANAAQNSKAEEIPEEKQANPVQPSADPLVEAGKEPKKTKEK